MRRTNALYSAMLRIMHPEQYEASQRLSAELRKQLNLRAVLSRWGALPFNAVTFVSNRESPYHRDSKTALRLFDIMTSVGSYSNAPMHLPGLGIVVQNYPGTVIALSGRTFQHGVPAFDGDRICYAMYVREALYERKSIRLPPLPQEDMYKEFMGPEAGLALL